MRSDIGGMRGTGLKAGSVPSPLPHPTPPPEVGGGGERKGSAVCNPVISCLYCVILKLTMFPLFSGGALLVKGRRLRD